MGARAESALRWRYCGVESNRAIRSGFGCPAAAPSPLTHPTEAPWHPAKAFRRFGQSAAGALRFCCRSSKATFSVPGPTARERRTRANAPIFRHLVNKVRLNRIVDLCEVSFPAL